MLLILVCNETCIPCKLALFLPVHLCMGKQKVILCLHCHSEEIFTS